MPRLFVGKLSKIFYEDNQILKFYFSQFGKVNKIEVKKKFNPKRNNFGYFGIVSFMDTDASVDHIIRIKTHVIAGKEIDVGIYYGSSEKTFQSGNEMDSTSTAISSSSENKVRSL